MSNSLLTPTIIHLRPQFSLRWLLIAVTLFGIWLPLNLRWAKEQKKAVRRIQGVWGNVTYDYQAHDGFPRTSVSPVPRWLLDPLGEDFFHGVISANVNGGYEDLGRLESLRKLSIRDTAMTDAEAQYLSTLHNLRELRITTSSRLTSTGGMQFGLRYTISSSQPYFILHGGRPFSRRLGDSTLKILAQLPQLEILHIEGSEFTPQGLAALANSTSLREVHLATCDQSISPEVALPFRLAGRVRELTITKWCDEKGEETVVAWDELP